MKEMEELILKTADMSRAAPQEWRGFVAAAGRYAALLKEQCVQSPLEMLQRNQGRAQQASEFVTLFNEAVSKADRLITQAAHKA